MLFCNGFSVELSKFEANIERDRKKEVEHNMSTLFLQLTQVLMSQIVAARKISTLNELKQNDHVHVTCQHLARNFYAFISVLEFWLQTLFLQKKGHLYHLLRQENVFI